MEVLELEKQKLQDRCLCLEAEVLEKKKKLHLREEEHRRQDAVRVQSIEEQKAVASHWAEKWQKVALTLQSTHEELEKLRKNNSRNKVRSFKKITLCYICVLCIYMFLIGKNFISAPSGSCTSGN